MSSQPTSLFRRTVLTIAAGLLLFQLGAGIAIGVNLILPLAQRSANDLADFLVLTARVWAELPAAKRPGFIAYLAQQHQLHLSQPNNPLVENNQHYPYIRFLRHALQARLTPAQHLRLSEQTTHDYFQVEFTQNTTRLRFEFTQTEVPPKPSWAVSWIVLVGLFASVALAWLLARQVTTPVARLAQAAQRMGTSENLPPLPEEGAAELVALARAFNTTAKQLHARRENQTTLLAGVSHDLRSPLARMRMALGMLAEESNSPLLARMERDIVEMNRLIGAQLELARAQEPEQAQPIDLPGFLTELLALAEAHSPGRVSLRKHQPLPGQIIVASLALQRCLHNLLDNALRYGNDQPVQIICRCCRTTVFIGIRDRGPGIPPALIEAVFRPFYRLETSRNRDTGGSGLGLAITRQLTLTHGWQVTLKNRHGGGLSAWLRIPH